MLNSITNTSQMKREISIVPKHPNPHVGAFFATTREEKVVNAIFLLR